MNPLLFVNWRAVDGAFTKIMWAVAIVLAIIVLTRTIPHSTTVHHAAISIQQVR